MKGSTRIVGAFTLGAVVVTAAFFLRGGETSGNTGQLALVTDHEIMKPRSVDINENGIEDWREELEKNLLQEVIPSFAANASGEPNEEPKTFTDRFAQAFFQDYMEGKMEGATLADPTLIDTAIGTIERNTGQKIYTIDDMVIIDNSEVATREYGNRIGEIIKNHSIENENEAAILAQALNSKDPQILKKLDPIKTAYAGMVKDALLVPTPRELVSEHLALLLALEAIRTDIEAMEQAFTDPLLTLARMKRYEDDVRGLYGALVQMHVSLDEAGVVYSSEEPGYLFYLFDHEI